MIILGLTGGIASGKSTVAEQLSKLGAEIVDADYIARVIVQPGKRAWHNIVACFGEQILLEDSTINRKQLGACIFQDAEKRKQLEAITHPEIMAVIDEHIASARQRGLQILVLEIPLLIEVGWQDLVQKIWLVYVKRDIQLQRLMERDKITLADAELRLAAQMSLDAKRKYADVIIDNSGTPNETKDQVLKAWEELRQCVQLL